MGRYFYCDGCSNGVVLGDNATAPVAVCPDCGAQMDEGQPQEVEFVGGVHETDDYQLAEATR